MSTTAVYQPDPTVAVAGAAAPVAIRWLMPRTMNAAGTAAVNDAVSGTHLMVHDGTVSIRGKVCVGAAVL